MDISNHMAIPQPTMTRIIEKLISANILHEQGLGTSTGGRRPILLTFNESCSYAVGVEIGRSDIKVALTNMNGDLLSFTTKETRSDEAIDEIVLKVKKTVDKVLADTGIERSLILGVGIGVPGPLNELEDGRISPPNFYGETDIPMKEMLEEQLDFPVTIDNDANVAALAEKWFGQGKGIANFAYVHADVGVGSGLIINNDIYRGRYGEAGEIGHSTIDVFGKRCACGNYGCLENFVSIPAIIDKFQNSLRHLPTDNQHPFTKRIEHLNFEDVLQAVDEGFGLAQQVLKETGQLFGAGIANLINLFAPNVVILGGKVGTSHPLFHKEVTETMKTRVLGSKGKDVKVVVTDLNSGVVSGAAALVIHRFFYKRPLK
ncbi:ROK family protein [Virgibacillus halophilus]|uniref:ROK family protein n=1 Tax=Tigheibacillus halophilus TaxID=361280 RepID=A0ABU5C2G4_9BACI|nr:ROK family protein [Virgibacillus halophilus]